MGIFEKIFGDRDKQQFLTDDERELREYEENVYRAESGVADTCHAEFIITSFAPTTDGRVKVSGSVTEGTLKVGDEVSIDLRNKQTITNRINAVTVHSVMCESATEGQNAELLLDALDVKMLKRNDIIKKIIKE
jgi:translation elongation factor EF-Tu-like GTPase